MQPVGLKQRRKVFVGLHAQFTVIFDLKGRVEWSQLSVSISPLR